MTVDDIVPMALMMGYVHDGRLNGESFYRLIWGGYSVIEVPSKANTSAHLWCHSSLSPEKYGVVFTYDKAGYWHYEDITPDRVEKILNILSDYAEARKSD